VTSMRKSPSPRAEGRPEEESFCAQMLATEDDYATLRLWMRARDWI
jgi:hypothetical protein